MLLVDNAEPDKIFNLLSRQGTEHKKTTLPVGDFYQNGVVIERKSVPDFISSIRSGHLQKQLVQMDEGLKSGVFKASYLIVSGVFSKEVMYNRYIKNWTVEHQLGALASISARYLTKVVQVENDTQLVKLISKLVDKSTDNKNVTVFETELMKSKMTTDDLRAKMIGCIDGIGLGKAKEISEISNLCLFDKKGEPMTTDILCKIEGIGKKIADKILNSFDVYR